MKNRFKTLLAVLLPALLLVGAGCTKKDETTTTTTTTTSSDSAAPAGELKKEDVTVGTGAEVTMANDPDLVLSGCGPAGEISRIHHDVVVAESVVFVEAHGKRSGKVVH